MGKQVASAREIADGAHARHKPLAARVTELEALEKKAASGSRKLEQRAVETIESLAARTELAEVVGEALGTRGHARSPPEPG